MIHAKTSTKAKHESLHGWTDYPVLGLNVSAGRIVLFTSLNTGVVVDAGSEGYKVGFFSDNWYSELYVKSDAEVTISNK